MASRSEIKICGACQALPAFYVSLKATFWYRAPIDQLITGYMYFNHWEHAHTLIQLSLKQFFDVCTSSLVIPVPSHPARIRQRGFNAVYELIRLYSKYINFDYDFNCLQRTRYTETQTVKSKMQRIKNVRDAFSLVKKIDYEEVTIFDEVVTTSATVNEIS